MFFKSDAYINPPPLADQSNLGILTFITWLCRDEGLTEDIVTNLLKLNVLDIVAVPRDGPYNIKKQAKTIPQH